MRILYLTDIRFPMERANGLQTIETCHAMARAGLQVELVVRRSDSRSDEACLEFFVLKPHRNLALRRLWIPAPGTVRGKLVFLGRCFPILIRGNFDAVFTRDLALADLLLRTGWIHRVPVFYEAHTAAALYAAEATRLYQGSAPSNRRKLLRLDRRERRVCRKAASLVTISRSLLNCLERLHGPLAPAQVISDGARLTESTSPPRQRESGEPVEVYYIGQLYPWKGVDVLIESMRDLPLANLVIIGGLPPEPDLERTRELARRLGISSRVKFLGYLPPPQVAEERPRADIFVIPLLDSTTARDFTSPLKLFEAMAANRPIVASDLPTIREVLTDEANALLVQPGNPEALAGAIRKLALNPALGLRLASRAREDAKQYSWDRRGQQLAELLKKGTE